MIPFYGWVIAGIIIGLGLMRFLISRLKNAEKDRIENINKAAYIKAEKECILIEKEVKDNVEKQLGKDTTNPIDW